MPFLGFEAQCQHCLGPQIRPCFVSDFHPPQPLLNVIVHISCFAAVKFPEYSIQSCVRKPKAQVTCVGFMS